MLSTERPRSAANLHGTPNTPLSRYGAQTAIEEEETLLRAALEKTSQERRAARLLVASGATRPRVRPPTPISRGRPVPTPSPTLPPLEYVRTHGVSGSAAFSRSHDGNSPPRALPPSLQPARPRTADAIGEDMARKLELDYMQEVVRGDGSQQVDGVIRAAPSDLSDAFVKTDARAAAHAKVTAMKKAGVAQIVSGDYDGAAETFKAALMRDPNQGRLGVGFEQPIQDFLDPWMVEELEAGLRRAEQMAARKEEIEAERAAKEARQRRKAEQLADLARNTGRNWLVRAEAERGAAARRREEVEEEARRKREAEEAERAAQAAAVARRKEAALTRIEAAEAAAQLRFEERQAAREAVVALKEAGERALANDEFVEGLALLEEALTPQHAAARASISVDFDNRITLALSEGRARQAALHAEAEAHRKRRDAIAAKAAADAEAARRRRRAETVGATKMRRQEATERLAARFTAATVGSPPAAREGRPQPRRARPGSGDMGRVVVAAGGGTAAGGASYDAAAAYLASRKAEGTWRG